MTDILMIPHEAATAIRTRSRDLAIALGAEGRSVDLYKRNLQPRGLNFGEKVRWNIDELLSGFRRENIAPNVRSVTPPTVHRGSIPIKVVNRVASALLLRQQYGVVVSSAYYESVAPLRLANTKTVYDFVDDHAASFRHVGNEKTAVKVEKYIADQFAHADIVVASSHGLVETARTRYNRQAHLIPNGANVGTIRSALQPKESSRPSVGYIGGLDDWVQIGFVVRVLEMLRAGGLDIEFVIVGDERGAAIRGRKMPSWVKVLGFRPPEELPLLMNTFDVGLVPFTLSPFTDAALPLKVLEYGAARKLCVSSPLAELQHHQFPWVTLVDLDEQKWASAIADALRREWDLKWDASVDQYEWRDIAKRLMQVIA